MRIFLVEDDQAQADAMRALLAGYHVDWVPDGESAWRILSKVPYDLFIIDVQLPRWNGIELCRRLRKSGDRTPILLLTADVAVDKRIEGLNEGADDYINKPVLAAEFIARVKNLLRRGNVKPSNTLIYGALSLDPIAHLVSYDGRKMELTPKEFALLEIFLSQPERVFSRSQLVTLLWPQDSDVMDSTVKAHIKGLRHKLRMIGACDPITNVRGIGYKLAEESGPRTDERADSLNRKMHSLWKTYQPLMLNRVDEIARATAGIESNVLSNESRLSAYHHAHSLAGSLGLFNRGEVTDTVRRIERAFSSEYKEINLEELYLDIERVRLAITEGVGEFNERNITPLEKIDATVLAVDDDSVFLGGVELLLARLGMNVVTLNQPENIKEVLDSVRPHLLLLDYAMPGHDGIGICRDLRSDVRWRTLPILFVTATQDTEVIKGIFDAMADDYIGKPLNPAEFGARVANRLRRMLDFNKKSPGGNDRG